MQMKDKSFVSASNDSHWPSPVFVRNKANRVAVEQLEFSQEYVQGSDLVD